MYIADSKRLTHQGAKSIMTTAIELAREAKVAISCAIVDAGGHLEADDGSLALVDARLNLHRRQLAASARVLRWTAGSKHLPPVCVELLRRAETVIRMPCGKKLVSVRGVQVKAL